VSARATPKSSPAGVRRTGPQPLCYILHGTGDDSLEKNDGQVGGVCDHTFKNAAFLCKVWAPFRHSRTIPSCKSYDRSVYGNRAKRLLKLHGPVRQRFGGARFGLLAQKDNFLKRTTVLFHFHSTESVSENFELLVGCCQFAFMYRPLLISFS
jgi:hypothetical protein